jgi:hypothetical protein
VEAAASDVTEGEPTIMPLKEANTRDLSPEERKKGTCNLVLVF